MPLTIARVDYADPVQGAQLVALLDAYARDPMGGGAPLSDAARANLLPGLRGQPNAFSLIAYRDGKPVGLANCFLGFSTFAAKPLVNIHDVAVLSEARGQGVATALFSRIEEIAAEAGACKVTLEVLSGNNIAKSLYAKLGYGDYQLDPQSGSALFWQKRIAA